MNAITPITAEAITEEERRRFRDVIGCFATGVTVVTWQGDTGAPRGMTANAVTSLSLDPLLIIVCVGRGSSAHEQLATAEAFAINILADDQEEISRAFAKRAPDGVPDVASRPGQMGAPILDGAIAWLECSIAERLEGGDHTIYVGAVSDFKVERGDAGPLLFFSGRYARMGAQP